jgi:hypothetical protein
MIAGWALSPGSASEIAEARKPCAQQQEVDGSGTTGFTTELQIMFSRVVATSPVPAESSTNPPPA